MSARTDGNVYALNASTGTLLWSYTHWRLAVYSSPAVANGVVYVGSDEDTVYALNASTGALLWSYTTGSVCDFLARRGEWGGLCRAGYGDDRVYALNANTGALLWSYTHSWRRGFLARRGEWGGLCRLATTTRFTPSA